jgi:tRNA threonylcarbamoyladenosine biosynthesis protein TsaB
MNIVAIETATETVGLALRTADGVEASFALTGRRRHVESLTPALSHLLEQVGLSARDLHAVAVDLGPGLFTGLRVGVAAAKGLALALDIGVVGLSSLDVLLQASRQMGHRGLVLAAVDARRGEVFAAVRRLGDGPDPGGDVIAPGLFAPDALVTALATLAGEPVLSVGDGARRYGDVLATVSGLSGIGDGLTFPPPLTLLHMAVAMLEAGIPPVAPAGVVPLYMRDADAVSNFAQITRS